MFICANRQQEDPATFNVREYFEVQIKNKKKTTPKQNQTKAWSQLKHDGLPHSPPRQPGTVNVSMLAVGWSSSVMLWQSQLCYQRSGTEVLSPRRRLSSAHNRNSWLMFRHTSDVAGGARAAL